jgi:hypothetical protein
MGIAYRTSLFSSAGSPTAGMTATVPGAVNAGDLVVIYGGGSGGSLPGGATNGIRGTTTGTPLIANTAQGIDGNNGADNVWSFIAGAGDPGSTQVSIQCTDSGVPISSAGYYVMIMMAYSGAAAIEAIAKFNNGTASASSITAPNATTLTANDWAAYFAQFIAGGSITAEPGTLRASGAANASVGSDSNGIVGPAGTVIGGGTFTASASAPWSAWTVAIKAASAPAHAGNPMLIAQAALL